jgi:hypothetical protein
MRYDHGMTKKSFGLVLFDGRFTDKPVYYYFRLYPEDSYEISWSDDLNAKFNKYFSRQKNTGMIRHPGLYNDLELQNKDGVLTYYINDHKAWSKEKSAICITKIGFFTEGFQQIQVEYLEIRQDGWRRINLVDSSFRALKKENWVKQSPMHSADGQVLYLCVQFDTANLGPADDQDIWYSTLNSDITWSKRVNIGEPLNDVTANGVSYVSPDNNTLLVDNQYDKFGHTIGEGFSISSLTKTGWSIPEKMEIDNYYNRNRYYSVTYSPSGKTLILSIERDDSFGDKDLYASFKKDDGSWSEPLNMGPTSTPSGLSNPILAADNSTLIFQPMPVRLRLL